MSLDLTFRQKTIRIGCSAAICGLSFSFVIGEVVDRQAKLIRTWTIDPDLVPINYQPLRPVEAAMLKFEEADWREQLVAINSLPMPTSAPVLFKEVELVAKLPVPPTPAPVVLKIPVEAVAKKEVELRPAEVEEILVSIHSATAKLSGATARSLYLENAPGVSQTSHQPKVSPRGTPRKPPPPIATSVPPKKQTDETTDEGEKTVASNAGWPLNGKILTTTAQLAEPGHFEVGLFSKIDPDGKPVGYPLPQQILPSGQATFRLDVPTRIERGYLFAEFVAAGTGKRTLISPAKNPWVRGAREVAELLFFRHEDAISTVAASSMREVQKDQWRVRGTVSTMFAGAISPLVQGDVVVRVRGRKESARTDRQGNFAIDLPRLKGTLFLEVLKPGYHPSIVSVSVEDQRPVLIEIASRHAIDQLSQRLGANQGSSRGILVGRATTVDGVGIRGFTAQLSLKADGPFYFDDEGVATRDAKSTSANGRFLFLNVEAGTGFVETAMNSEQIAPVQVSSVEGGELIQKVFTPLAGSIRGRIFNPVAQPGKLVPLGGAKVRLDGASEWVNSDAFGAFSIGPLRWIKGEKISLEVSAEKFNNHRYQVSAETSLTTLNLFAFPAAYIGRLARSMDIDLDPYSGVIVGKVSGPGLRIDALADHSTVNNAKDFYFDARGRLRGSHEMTDPKFGTFVIFNVPKGRALLQGNDSSGVLRYSDAVFANPSSINVQMD